MTIAHKYKEFEIDFDQATEIWSCGVLALENKSLNALKKAIDKESKGRRTVNVPALYLYEEHNWGGPNKLHIKPVTITLIRERDKAQVKLANKQSEQIDMSCLYAPSQRAALEAYVAAEKASADAQDRASKLQDKLVWLTAEAIREIVAQQADREPSQPEENRREETTDDTRAHTRARRAGRRR